jgi:hypothetical protein
MGVPTRSTGSGVVASLRIWCGLTSKPRLKPGLSLLLLPPALSTHYPARAIPLRFAVTMLAEDRFVGTRTMRATASLVTAGTHANPATGASRTWFCA